MAGYPRKLISLENALKQIIKELKAEGLKAATDKTESHFRKCSDENDPQDIHHKDSIAIDIECLKRQLGTPMLDTHEDILDSVKMDNEITDNASNILIHIGARIGKLMETTHRAVSPEGEGGKRISQSEKNNIAKAINDVEKKILQLKALIDSTK